MKYSEVKLQQLRNRDCGMDYSGFESWRGAKHFPSPKRPDKVWVPSFYWKQRSFFLLINPLAPELFFLILEHPVYKMWITQAPNKLALWNVLHFEEKKSESTEHV